jgi:aspartyl/glutamyl-tRNA(Asn/Gln) amidotransferase C subunit
MARFTREDLLKIAELSALDLLTDEVDVFADQLHTVLEYTQELARAAISHEDDGVRAINVFREDKPLRRDATPLTSNSPQFEDHYFIVPKIL